MSERVVDASVIVKLALKGEPHRITARRLVRESTAAGVNLIAPPFFTSEVDTAICKRIFDGQLSRMDAQRAYHILDRTSVHPVIHPNMRQRAREIAEQFNQRTVYDATYAALAELRGCEFWTADKAFYDAVKAALSFVKYLPDYP
jgi:predicted nucleic acid-binding protein